MLRQRRKQAQTIARLKNFIPSPPRSVEDDEQPRILSELARFGPNNYLFKVNNLQELRGQNEEKITINNYLPADIYDLYLLKDDKTTNNIEEESNTELLTKQLVDYFEKYSEIISFEPPYNNNVTTTNNILFLGQQIFSEIGDLAKIQLHPENYGNTDSQQKQTRNVNKILPKKEYQQTAE